MFITLSQLTTIVTTSVINLSFDSIEKILKIKYSHLVKIADFQREWSAFQIRKVLIGMNKVVIISRNCANIDWKQTEKSFRHTIRWWKRRTNYISQSWTNKNKRKAIKQWIRIIVVEQRSSKCHLDFDFINLDCVTKQNKYICTY